MPTIHQILPSHSSNRKLNLNKGAVIGGVIGGVYVLICVVVLVLLMRRRRKRRIIREQLETSGTANHSTEYVEYNDHLNGKPPPSRSFVMSEPGYRPPTRRFGHERNVSEGTVMRGAISNPFWMFDGIYEETETTSQGRSRSHSSPQHRRSNSSPKKHRRSNSSPKHRRSDSSPKHHRSNSSRHYHSTSISRHRRSESNDSFRDLSFEIRPATAMSMQMHMPTSIFVSEMNARFPNAGTKSTANSQIRQVPPSPSPSSSLFNEMVEGQEDGPIPPIAIHPLMRKTSIDRIVSGAQERISRERERERNNGPELIRVGTLDRGEKMKIVHVPRNKSVSALSERFMARMRKSRAGVLEEVEEV